MSGWHYFDRYRTYHYLRGTRAVCGVRLYDGRPCLTPPSATITCANCRRQLASGREWTAAVQMIGYVRRRPRGA